MSQDAAMLGDLCSLLFVEQNLDEATLFKQRQSLFESLLVFFPDEMKQPHSDLIDLL